MAFVKYSETERRRMAEIYVECGGNGRAIPHALKRIKNELGICLPKDGRNLRNLKNEFKLEAKPKDAEVLFPGMLAEQHQTVMPARMSFDEYQEALQAFAGNDYAQDRQLLNDIYNELKTGRVKESLKSKSPEELMKLKQMIEDAQQKRERHLMQMTDYVDFRNQNKKPDMDKIEKQILLEMGDAV